LTDPDVADLLDHVAAAVLKNSGHVVIVPAEPMPTQTGIAAIPVLNRELMPEETLYESDLTTEEQTKSEAYDAGRRACDDAETASTCTFAIMSQFHYGPGVRIVTCDNFELARSHVV
jgi:hypothetical protein